MRSNIIPVPAYNKSLLGNTVVLETRRTVLFHKLDSIAVLLYYRTLTSVAVKCHYTSCGKNTYQKT